MNPYLRTLLIASIALPASCTSPTMHCTPDCSATRCGPDPVCGVSCGECPRLPTIESHFDSGTEGWSIEGYETDVTGWMLAHPPVHAAEFDPTGGVAASGALYRNEEIYGYAEYFIAPPQYLGAQGAYYGGTLRFSIRQEDTLHPFVGPLVMLGGATETLIIDTASDPTTTFTPYRVLLSAAAGWVRFSDRRPASESDVRAVLGDLRAVRIRGEYSNNADKSWMDDVVMAGM